MGSVILCELFIYFGICQSITWEAESDGDKDKQGTKRTKGRPDGWGKQLPSRMGQTDTHVEFFFKKKKKNKERKKNN